METAYVIPGKIGDCLSAIPIIDFLRGDKKAHVVTSSKYADVFHGIEWAIPHVLNEDWQNLHSFIEYAKKRFRKVEVLSTYGKTLPIKNSTPSFQLDQYYRAGILKNWDNLIFHLPVQRWVHGHDLKKTLTILIADFSESAPFEGIEELVHVVSEKFPEYKIVRLSSMFLPNFKDFLHLYDTAQLLITVDTAHLHLSAFSTIPVIAFSRDTPSKWNGAAYSKRFYWYCRYSDWNMRKVEFLHYVKNALSGVPRLTVSEVKTDHKNAYNLGIIKHEGRLLKSYRYHDEPKKWRTKLAMIDGEKCYPINMHSSLSSELSFEDLRMFNFKGKLYGSYVVSRYGDRSNGFTPCVTGYGEMQFKDGSWNFVEHIQPKFGKNNYTGQEKNWLYWEHGGNLYCSYQCSPEHIVLQLDGDRVVREYRTKCPEWAWGQIRGGTQPIPYNGILLRLFHSQTNNRRQTEWWHYYVGAMLMEPEPPFQIRQLSEIPVMSGTEKYYPEWRYWKPNVLIPYGAVENALGILVSFGVNDSACATVFIEEKYLNLK